MGDGQFVFYDGKKRGQDVPAGGIKEPQTPEDQQEEDFHRCMVYTILDECSSDQHRCDAGSKSHILFL